MRKAPLDGTQMTQMRQIFSINNFIKSVVILSCLCHLCAIPFKTDTPPTTAGRSFSSRSAFVLS